MSHHKTLLQLRNPRCFTAISDYNPSANYQQHIMRDISSGTLRSAEEPTYNQKPVIPEGVLLSMWPGILIAGI